MRAPASYRVVGGLQDREPARASAPAYWVVADKGGPQDLTWSGASWVTSDARALRFAREEDAVRYAQITWPGVDSIIEGRS